jgi:hypothetical protein
VALYPSGVLRSALLLYLLQRAGAVVRTHAMKAHRCIRGSASHIFSHCTEWQWAVGSQLQAPVALSSGNNLLSTPTLGPGAGLVKGKICCVICLLGCLTLEYGTDRLSRNVGKQTTNLRCVKCQTKEDLRKISFPSRYSHPGLSSTVVFRVA